MKKMKINHWLILPLTLSLAWTCSLLFSMDVIAQNRAIKDKYIDVKCHVELSDGQETIYLAVIPQFTLQTLANELVNRKIPTAFSQQQQQVNQVFQCIELTGIFKSSKARKLFASFPR